MMRKVMNIGEADENLVGRELLCAESLTEQSEDDDDTREAGHHQEDRGSQREDGEQNDDLHAGGEVFAFGEIGNLMLYTAGDWVCRRAAQKRRWQEQGQGLSHLRLVRRA